MSEIKVNKITPRTACGTTTLGDSGDTFTVPSGATIQNLGTATGFGGTGVVSWETGSIKTSGFTAVTGTGYFCNTTGGIFTVTLPLSPAAGAVVGVSDYAQTFDTNNLTLGRNSSNIGGEALDAELSTQGIAVTLVYVDATKGWIVTDSGLQSEVAAPLFLAATGGCITTCGNFKMHTFTGPNTFVVTCAGNCAGSNTVDYMVIAGGGGGGGHQGGAGGGAGGYRESPGTASGSYTVSPLGAAPAAALPVTATPYAIQVGGGGAGGISGNPCATQRGQNGGNSIFSTITSTAGGGGGAHSNPNPGQTGGSGGGSGGRFGVAGGIGNTPPTSPAQGTPGGDAAPSPTPGANDAGGGGGGATVAAANAADCVGSDGGAGATTSINAVATARAGGGGGGNEGPNYSAGGTGNPGGTGGQGCDTAAGAGTINKGGGGGGSGTNAPGTGGAGGSGIVVIRYKYQ